MPHGLWCCWRSLQSCRLVSNILRCALGIWSASEPSSLRAWGPLRRFHSHHHGISCWDNSGWLGRGVGGQVCALFWSHCACTGDSGRPLCAHMCHTEFSRIVYSLKDQSPGWSTLGRLESLQRICLDPVCPLLSPWDRSSLVLTLISRLKIFEFFESKNHLSDFEATKERSLCRLIAYAAGIHELRAWSACSCCLLTTNRPLWTGWTDLALQRDHLGSFRHLWIALIRFANLQLSVLYLALRILSR